MWVKTNDDYNTEYVNLLQCTRAYVGQLSGDSSTWYVTVHQGMGPYTLNGCAQDKSMVEAKLKELLASANSSQTLNNIFD